MTFESKAHAHKPVTRTARPALNLSLPVLSISADAPCYYTLDGSFPAPANPAATLYTSGIDVHELPAGTLVKAAAFEDGKAPSLCAHLIL